MEQVANILGIEMYEWFDVRNANTKHYMGTYRLTEKGLEEGNGEARYFALTLLLNGNYEVKR